MEGIFLLFLIYVASMLYTYSIHPCMHDCVCVCKITAKRAPQGLRNHLGGLLRGVVSTGCCCCWLLVMLANGSSLC